jgi:hypothetical protein
MWTLYNRCQTFQQSPSGTIGIRANPWLAWQFDNAVFTFGRWVDSKLNERDKKGKPKHKIEALLGIQKVMPEMPAEQVIRMLEAAFGVTMDQG